MSDNILNGLLGGLGKDNNLLLSIVLLFLLGDGGGILGNLFGGQTQSQPQGPGPGPGPRRPY